MAQVYTRVVSMYLAGRNIGTSVVSASVVMGLADAHDITVFGDTAERVLGTGRRSDAVSISARFDDEQSMDDLVGSGAIGATANNIMMLMIGTATGARAWCGTGILVQANNPTDVAGLVMSESVFKPDSAIDGCVHFGSASTFTSANGTGIVNSLISNPSGTSVGTAAFYVSMVTGSFGGGTAKVFLQHFTGGVFVNIATALFTGSTTGSSVRLLTTASAGTMQPTARVIWESDGTDITVVAALARAPYSDT